MRIDVLTEIVNKLNMQLQNVEKYWQKQSYLFLLSPVSRIPPEIPGDIHLTPE